MKPAIDPTLLARFDADRSWGDKSFRSACYAPFTSMYFDQRGFVRVCCQNYQHSLGNLTHQTLDEVWNGIRAQMLRGALKRYDFSLGCQYCEWQLREGNLNNFAREYDVWPIPSADILWPTQMEFSISNTCNLECVMCNGEWSSSIRTKREKLPPLPKVYGDAFFDDLRKYLPHLKRMRFLGGEPFLAAEHFRIWEMAIEQGLSPDVHVTTNGTQFNERVERILNHFPVSISVSMDGASAETLERVRRNADYARVRENVSRFREYARQRGTWFGLTFCLMPPNWHEFGAYLQLADELDCDVTVNTVLHPPEFSFYSMSSRELAPFVEGLRQQGEEYLPKLKRNQKVFVAELDRLRHRMENADTSLLDFVPGKLVQLQMKSAETPTALPHSDLARQDLSTWGDGSPIARIECDPQERVVEMDGDDFLGLARAEGIGKPMESIYALLRMKYGGMTAVHRKEHAGLVDRLFGFQGTDLVDRTMRMITFPREGARGSVSMAVILDEPYLSAQHRPRFSTTG
jgi:MoaA/NifB/PqqE/SkfB family radical SAM enzyme